MQNKEIVDFFRQFANDKGYLDIPEEIFAKMEEDHGKVLVEELDQPRLFKLPEYEIQFFEWLKENDRPVWDDLWKNDNEHGLEEYVVGISFLPLILKKDGRGLPICDLYSVDNYYFTNQQLVGEESKVILESAKIRFQNKENISIGQLLAIEIDLGAIDIWHFACKHNIDLQKAKEAVHELVDDYALVHLKDASHLSSFIDF